LRPPPARKGYAFNESLAAKYPPPRWDFNLLAARAQAHLAAGG